MNKHVISRFAPLAFLLAMGYQVSAFGHGDEDHGTNDALHGGLVMMYIDLHFEVAIGEDGGIDIYYTDAERYDLPAAVASNVQVEIIRDDAPLEFVAMEVSDAGDYWTGESAKVVNPETIIRVAFVFQGEPVVYELPARLFPAFTGQDSENQA